MHFRHPEEHPSFGELVFCTLFTCLIAACSRESAPQATVQPESSGGVVTIYVVNYPLQYFAERVGGEHVQVVLPIPPDEDPAFWRPGTDLIAEYQQADLILLNGASYAKWLGTASLPDSKTVNTSASFTDRYIEMQDVVTHSHGPDTKHAHAGTAFTTWLNPELAIKQAKEIKAALTDLRPQHADAFQQGFDALKSDLENLDGKLRETVEGRSEQAILFSHPVYQYLQQHYGLNARSVHWEPDTVAPQAKWDELSAQLTEHPAKWMIWEDMPSEENVQRLKDLGLNSTVFDPCAGSTSGGDYLTVMRQNVQNLGTALGN